QRLVREFLKMLPQQLTELRDASPQGDHRALSRTAHMLKRPIANFGTRPAYESAGRLEQSAKKADAAGIASAQPEFEKQLNRLVGELDGYLQQCLEKGGTTP